MKIQTVTVIGANGTMGTNVAGIFASFGNTKTYMVSRSIEKSEAAIVNAGKSVRAESITANMIPVDYDSLEACVAESDLVFESVAENMDIKKDIMQRVANTAKKDAIICSGTSGLSITALAECLPEELRKNCFGVHMFNPPYNLTLCELIPTAYSDKAVQAELKDYLKNVLFRALVEVKDSPAFLGNRIGFQFINETIQYAEKYQDNGGIDYIDGILGGFTGRAMSPLDTADFVGLDVHKAIVDNLYENTNDYAHDTFVLPQYAQELIKEGKLGRKAKDGLYKMVKTEDGNKYLTVYDIKTGQYRVKEKYDFSFAKAMREALQNGDYQQAFTALLEDESPEAKLCVEFLLKYIVYALHIVKDLSDSVHAVDIAMATGFNWCPPLAMADALSTVTDLKQLMQERLDTKLLNQVNVDVIMKAVEPSKYDYRRFFKAN